MNASLLYSSQCELGETSCSTSYEVKMPYKNLAGHSPDDVNAKELGGCGHKSPLGLSGA